MPPFATGRASARHKLAVAVKAPRSSMLPAVEMGWLAGLPDDELEVFMKDYLQAVALLFDVAQLDVAIREISTLLPTSSLSEAVQARDRMRELTEKINHGLASLDILALRQAIEECENEGWPSETLQAAMATKEIIEGLLARLFNATSGKDLHHLRSLIRECENFGIPDRDLSEARARRDVWERFLLSLQTAIAEKDLGKLNDVIHAGQADRFGREIVSNLISRTWQQVSCDAPYRH